MSIIQRVAARLKPKAPAPNKWSQKELEALIGFKTQTATRVNRKQRRALGMVRAFTERGGRSGWIVNPGYRALAAEEKKRGQSSSED